MSCWKSLEANFKGVKRIQPEKIGKALYWEKGATASNCTGLRLKISYLNRTPINCLIVNLAVADIVYSLFLIPMVILTHISSHPEGISGKVLCTLLTDGILAWVGAASSVITLTAIAFERYYAVIYPHGNKGNLNMRKVKVSKIITRRNNIK